MSTSKFANARAKGIEIVGEDFLETGKAAHVFGAEDAIEQEEDESKRVTWEYLDNGDVWSNYAENAHGVVEAAYQDFLRDQTVLSRPIKSGEYIYELDFDHFTQKNMQIPPHTVRRVRRVVGGVAQEQPPPRKPQKVLIANDDEGDDDEEEEEKPKKKTAAKKKAPAKGKKRKDEEEDEEEPEEEEEEEKPKKRAAAKKKAPAKKAKADDDDYDEEEEKPKKKAAAKKAAPKKKAKVEEEEEEEEEDKPAKKGAAKKAAGGGGGGGGGAVLSGLTFAISGTLSAGRAQIEKKIKQYGGAVAGSVTKAVTHLLSTEDEVSKGTAKVTKAQDNGIPIVSEEFLNDAIEDGHIPAKIDVYLIQ